MEEWGCKWRRSGGGVSEWRSGGVSGKCEWRSEVGNVSGGVGNVSGEVE